MESVGGRQACYAGSRLAFRAPLRPLDGGHVAFLGGRATRGAGAPAPFPAILERELRVPCANLGVDHASPEAWLLDPASRAACEGARAAVVEVTGAANLSNRLYAVHPRRNDRFLRAAPALAAIFPEVDFAEICFTGHLLARLRAADADRFEVVREELRIAWGARMRALLAGIGPRAVILRWEPGEEGPMGPEPTFVTDAMVESLRPLVAAVVTAPAPGCDAAAHREVAAALWGPLGAVLADGLRASA